MLLYCYCIVCIMYFYRSAVNKSCSFVRTVLHQASLFAHALYIQIRKCKTYSANSPILSDRTPNCTDRNRMLNNTDSSKDDNNEDLLFKNYIQHAYKLQQLQQLQAFDSTCYKQVSFSSNSTSFAVYVAFWCWLHARTAAAARAATANNKLYPAFQLTSRWWKAVQGLRRRSAAAPASKAQSHEAHVIALSCWLCRDGFL